MNRGDKINLKDGAEAIITKCGISDFIGDPHPVYYTAVRNGQSHDIGDTGFIMSNELKTSKGSGGNK